ncbi:MULTISPECIES: hypothetical protein [Streptomyces]|uniref:hypothetical protein n=1 Tax=Streptomyces TaxID=1883 RepID=UPI00164E376E|nr:MULTISPECIES: hypothetical protein [Streptomyces]MBC3981407.1 hypothetical protein [Streptomyces buecherae]MBC3993275.1 hypothetical protein [Streptomyces buecherae]QNJ44813.1 hypothetical protein H7H31_17085 [Streptomyces buecherae]WEV26660.1 hypothetical protein OYE22_16730 [Streptomyces sp. 71268]
MSTVQRPPHCPTCGTRPLWKDTSAIRSGKEDRWLWYCTTCLRTYLPTGDHKRRYA